LPYSSRTSSPRESAHAWFSRSSGPHGRRAGFLNYLPTSKHLHVLTSIPTSTSLPRAEGCSCAHQSARRTLTKYGGDGHRRSDVETAPERLHVYRVRTLHLSPVRRTLRGSFSIRRRSWWIFVRGRWREPPPRQIPRPAETPPLLPATSSSIISSPSRSSGPVPRAWPACRSVPS